MKFKVKAVDQQGFDVFLHLQEVEVKIPKKYPRYQETEMVLRVVYTEFENKQKEEES